MQVITVDKAKQLLGISDTSLDASITSAIPFIDGAVKAITRNRWNTRILANTVAGSPYVELLAMYTSGVYWARPQYINYATRNFEGGYRLPDESFEAVEYVDPGQLVEGDGIADGSYIQEIYTGGGAITFGAQDVTPPVLQLSANATATGESVSLYLGIPIGYQPLIAKGVAWHIDQLNQSAPSTGARTRRIGPVTVTNSLVDTKIDGRYGVPSWFVKGLPRYHGGH